MRNLATTANLRNWAAIGATARGIGVFFLNLAIPLLKEPGNYGNKYAKYRLVDAGKNIIKDVVTNKTSVKDAFK